MKFRVIILAIFATVFSTAVTSAQALDTTLIKDLKNFFFNQTCFTPDYELFTKSDDRPYYILYISLPDRVERPKGLSHEIEDISWSDSLAIERALRTCDSLGFETMLYDVPADAGGRIRPEFSLYSNEGLAFVIFHELMHHFIRENNYYMPYLFEEAFCDVMAEFATLEFGKHDSRIDTAAAMKQVLVNDSIYSSVNTAISDIFFNPGKATEAAAVCDIKIKKYLHGGNSFQKFRFGYKVNKAFLLKTRNYSWNYFLCEQLYFERPSVSAFSKAVFQISDRCNDRPVIVEKHRGELYKNTSWNVVVHLPYDSTINSMFEAGKLRLVVTKYDPLPVFQSLLEENCSPDEINESECQSYWNLAVESLYKRSENISKNDTLSSAEYFGKAWLVSSSFIMDGHISCWMEPVDLFMGQTFTIDLTNENTTLIQAEDRSK